MLSNTKAISQESNTYQLIMTPDYLGLQNNSIQKNPPFYINFLSAQSLYRHHHATKQRELIARAINSHFKQPVIDATAGLGRDSFILAALGYRVIMLEQSAILYALLQDALRRAEQHAVTKSTIANMHLIHTNSIQWLSNLPKSQYPAVIYLDPMFPAKKKSALAKKEIQILQTLLGQENPTHSTALLTVALTCATQRVVVKRPRLASNLGNRSPTFSLIGKSSRFDVYQTL